MLMLLHFHLIIVTIVIHVLYLILSSLYCTIMNNQDGTTALHKAAAGGFTEIVKLLLDRGADIQTHDCVSNCMCIYSIADCGIKYVMHHSMLCHAMLCFQCMRI